jgi:hypothetical protein
LTLISTRLYINTSHKSVLFTVITMRISILTFNS